MIFLLPVALRLSGLFAAPLWYDEILSLQRAQLPFMDHARANLNAWEWMLRLFANPIAIRIPSFVCSIAAIWLAWKVSEQLGFTRRQRIATLVTLSTLPGLIWMAQDARYYSAVSLAFMASLYFALSNRWLGLFGVSALSVFIHPTAPAYMLPAWLLILRTAPSKVLASSAALPFVWSLVLIGNSQMGTVVTRSISSENIASQMGLALGAHPINILAALAFIGIVLLNGVIRPRWNELMIYLAPVVVLLLLNATYYPVVTYRTLQPSLFGLGLLIGTLSHKSKYLDAWFAILLALMLMFYDPGLHAGHIENATDFIRDAWTQGDCIRYEDEFSKTATSLLLEGYPECVGNKHSWMISNTHHDELPFAITDGWHFPTIYFYAP